MLTQSQIKEILRKNIINLRKGTGSSVLEETRSLSGWIGEKNHKTVHGYENGRGVPLYEALGFARLYGLPLEVLLTEEVEVPKEILTSLLHDSEETDLFYQALCPLQESAKGEDPLYFEKGWNYFEGAFDQDLPKTRDDLKRAYSAFKKYWKDSGDKGALVNMYFMLFYLFSIEGHGEFENYKAIRRHAEGLWSDEKTVEQLLVKPSPLSEEKDLAARSEFFHRWQGEIISILSHLKGDAEWADMGDYLLAHRYFVNMCDNDSSRYENQKTGLLLMLDLLELKNPYAAAFLQAFIRIFAPEE